MFLSKISVFMLSVLALGVNSTPMERFEKWVSEFKIEVRDIEHRENMLKKWIENDKYIEEINSMNKTYTLGHNQFSGMDSEDFNNYLGFSNQEGVVGREINPEGIKHTIDTSKCLYDCVKHHKEVSKLKTVECVTGCLDDDMVSSIDLADSVDWVAKGAVTHVKNQGQCGSCWSFSTTGALEGAYYLKYGHLESFSEQQLVDCSAGFHYGNHGCNGGLMDGAFQYAIDNGMCSEDAYPYNAKSGSCQSCTTVVTMSSCVDVTPQNEVDLEKAVSIGPVSVAIEADTRTFQLYTSGVITSDACGTNLDHGVLVAGYGTENNTPYWLVKNSWGTSWGENGYVKIGKSDSTRTPGVCGIAMQPSYPVV